MKAKGMLILVGGLGEVSKGLEKSLEELEGSRLSIVKID